MDEQRRELVRRRAENSCEYYGRMRFRLPSTIFIVLATWTAPAFGAEAAAPQPLEAPFVAGRDGYPVYRIPSLVVTKSETLLAFAEGRANLRDHAENTIVLRRSTDGGRIGCR